MDFGHIMAFVLIVVLMSLGIYIFKISLQESQNFWIRDIKSRIKMFILALAMIVSGVILFFKYIS